MNGVAIGANKSLSIVIIGNNKFNGIRAAVAAKLHLNDLHRAQRGLLSGIHHQLLGLFQLLGRHRLHELLE